MRAFSSVALNDPNTPAKQNRKITENPQTNQKKQRQENLVSSIQLKSVSHHSKKWLGMEKKPDY